MAGSEETKTALPGANAAFLADLLAFLRQEDAKRFLEQFVGYIESGGVHSPGAGLTHAPSALTAYPGGYLTTESGSIVYPDDSTVWVICHKDLTGDAGDYTRVAGTHYLIAVGAVQPTLPSNALSLMQVTTASGAVTAVSDLRTLYPTWASAVGFTAYGNIVATTVQAALQELDDEKTALAVLTTKGDLYVRTASGVTRLPIGADNKVLKALASATPGVEWGDVVLAVTGTAPVVSSGGTSPAISLADTAVAPGSYKKADFTVDAKGRLTAASHGAAIGARVYHNAAQSILDTTWTVLAFNSERWDTDAFHDPATNNSRLTAPRAGFYVITAHVRFAAGSAGRRLLEVRLGGSTPIGRTDATSTASADHALTVAAVYYLAAGAYVEVWVNQTSGGALDVEVAGNTSPEFAIAHLGD